VLQLHAGGACHMRWLGAAANTLCRYTVPGAPRPTPNAVHVETEQLSACNRALLPARTESWSLQHPVSRLVADREGAAFLAAFDRRTDEGRHDAARVARPRLVLVSSPCLAKPCRWMRLGMCEGLQPLFLVFSCSGVS